MRRIVEKLWPPSLALCAIVGCGRRAVVRGEAPPPSVELLLAESFDFRGDALRAHGFAERVLYRRDTGDAVATVARVQFPDRRTEGTAAGEATVGAPRASGNPLEQRVDASGGVRLETESGDRGSTDRASYRGREGRAFGDQPVQLAGPGYQVAAPGFTLDTVTDRLDLGAATLLTQGRAP